MLPVLFSLVFTKGDRMAVRTWALALVATCVAVTLGLSKPRSGLVDTMTDLAADLIGEVCGTAFGVPRMRSHAASLPGRMIGHRMRLDAKLFRRRG